MVLGSQNGGGKYEIQQSTKSAINDSCKPHCTVAVWSAPMMWQDHFLACVIWHLSKLPSPHRQAKRLWSVLLLHSKHTSRNLPCSIGTPEMEHAMVVGLYIWWGIQMRDMCQKNNFHQQMTTVWIARHCEHWLRAARSAGEKMRASQSHADRVQLEEEKNI